MIQQIFAILATTLSLSLPFSATALPHDVDVCECKNVQIGRNDEQRSITVIGVNSANQPTLYFVASMRAAIEPKPGACQTQACTSPKECTTTIDGSVTVHSDALLADLYQSNVLMVDGNPVSQASGPTAVSDTKSTECGLLMTARIEATSPPAKEGVPGTPRLWVQATFHCQSCLGIGAQH
ncbi:MAG: hypothetical protein IT457_02180 [Planctomycetes bacterium]|nr:hypothetical protein [Planctomycetota bacterium]